MNKLILPIAMSLMLFSTSAMALTINLNKKQHDDRPAPRVPSSVKCYYSEPKCDRHDRIHVERYDNDQQKYNRGECYRGDKERGFDFYCSNGDVWMRIDYRRDRVDRIDCYDPDRDRFFPARSIGECEDINRHGHHRHRH